jgi:toxin FitB
VIILDTNVVSEMMRPPVERDPAVVAWLAQFDGRKIYLTSLTVSEILFGLYVLPVGKRRTAYIERFQDIVSNIFGDRVLAYDRDAAEQFAHVAAQRYRAGRHVPRDDVRIASIAAVNAMSVATRNAADLEDCGITVINPWEYAGS